MRALFVVCVIDILGFGILIPLVPYMADRFGAAPELITPILGAYSLSQLIAAPFWGRLSDRYGRRPILMTSLAGACASYVILGLAHNLWWLLLSRVLAGFMAGNLAAAFAYASDISAPEHRAKSLGMVGAAIGIGFMLGPAIGGVLAGEDERTANFALPAAVSTMLSLVAIALVYFVLPESHREEHRAAHREPVRRNALQLLRERPILRFIVSGAFLVTCSQSILESIFAIWAMNRFGFGPRTVGLLFFCLALIPVVLQGGLVRLVVPRFGEARIAIAGILSYVAGLMLIAYSSHLPLAVAGLALCGVGSGLFSPTASALASKQATQRDRGAVMGTYQSGLSLARAVIPFASGAVYAALGPSAPFAAGACVTLPAAWLIWNSQRGARTMATP
ncbi:MAG: MFS transporter [Steroidobacteraceae bacterium]|nr:MFS transporter [Steroidobacteraceae bacterium]